MRSRAIITGRQVRAFFEDVWGTLRTAFLAMARDFWAALKIVPGLVWRGLQWLGRRPKWVAAWYRRIEERERCRREMRVYKVLVWVGPNNRLLRDYLSIADYLYTSLTKDEADTLTKEIVADAKQLGLAASCKVEVDRKSVR